MPGKQLLKPIQWKYCDYFWADKKDPQGNGTMEEGSLGEAWVQVKKSLTDEEEVHLKFSTKHHREIEKSLINFCEDFKKDMKKCDHHNADLCMKLTSCYTFVGNTQKALTEWQRDVEMKTQQLEIKLSNKKEDKHGESPTG
ncbi:Growth arrest-specific protein 7 [Sciurus carolinensis]|uniref:Growth arrest-specific protein 7 n=1 Tax=Sciurus carolinensis TaxID=30640 RepID=A0AA41T7B3_SCICA|nr:Growth arrest-specific protein 7 [Sciurus carolinensis]